MNRNALSEGEDVDGNELDLVSFQSQVGRNSHSDNTDSEVKGCVAKIKPIR
jgi:hypothetical protein